MLRADLERELAGIAEATSRIPDDEQGAEGSTVGRQRARTTALLAQTRQEIVDLTAALERATGDHLGGFGAAHGRCRQCGSPIDLDRLAALPAAVTCVACAGGDTRGGFRLVR
jgi:RNA polymerase-binding transcription factor DksA